MIHVRSYVFTKRVVLCAESNRWNDVTECQSDLRIGRIVGFLIFDMRQPREIVSNKIISK